MKKCNDDNFREIIKDSNNLVLDFGASWCGPCQKLEPILEELAEELAEIPFYKCDIGDNQKAASHFNIFSVPTIILFKDGNEITRINGLRDKAFLREEIQKLIG